MLIEISYKGGTPRQVGETSVPGIISPADAITLMLGQDDTSDADQIRLAYAEGEGGYGYFGYYEWNKDRPLVLDDYDLLDYERWSKLDRLSDIPRIVKGKPSATYFFPRQSKVQKKFLVDFRCDVCEGTELMEIATVVGRRRVLAGLRLKARWPEYAIPADFDGIYHEGVPQPQKWVCAQCGKEYAGKVTYENVAEQLVGDFPLYVISVDQKTGEIFSDTRAGRECDLSDPTVPGDLPSGISSTAAQTAPQEDAPPAGPR